MRPLNSAVIIVHWIRSLFYAFSFFVLIFLEGGKLDYIRFSGHIVKFLFYPYHLIFFYLLPSFCSTLSTSIPTKWLKNPVLTDRSSEEASEQSGIYTAISMSRDRAVGIATEYRLDYQGIAVRTSIGSRQAPIHWVPGDRSPRLKRLEREDDRSPPNSAEIKKMWVYTSTPPYAMYSGWLVEHRDNFTFISMSAFIVTH
jgi:hypothetical protein